MGKSTKTNTQQFINYNNEVMLATKTEKIQSEKQMIL